MSLLTQGLRYRAACDQMLGFNLKSIKKRFVAGLRQDSLGGGSPSAPRHLSRNKEAAKRQGAAGRNRGEKEKQTDGRGEEGERTKRKKRRKGKKGKDPQNGRPGFTTGESRDFY